jgi:hypothetical protein
MGRRVRRDNTGDDQSESENAKCEVEKIERECVRDSNL